jgi:phosphoglycolate phosphatase
MRGELVAIARAKTTRKHGVEVPPDRVVLVGDTPLDVAAAREGGARAVGVATGPYDAAALLKAGADAVLPDLSDSEVVVDAVLARCGTPGER